MITVVDNEDNTGLV